mmetsp:Transcript_11182/g.46952  ORF Transcript_11182/g.46952 Transcript_11182/m.46952 type:complete len:220 (-) Transcript_11182:1581-2240(-)
MRCANETRYASGSRTNDVGVLFNSGSFVTLVRISIVARGGFARARRPSLVRYGGPDGGLHVRGHHTPLLAHPEPVAARAVVLAVPLVLDPTLHLGLLLELVLGASLLLRLQLLHPQLVHHLRQELLRERVVRGHAVRQVARRRLRLPRSARRGAGGGRRVCRAFVLLLFVFQRKYSVAGDAHGPVVPLRPDAEQQLAVDEVLQHSSSGPLLVRAAVLHR